MPDTPVNMKMCIGQRMSTVAEICTFENYIHFVLKKLFNVLHYCTQKVRLFVINVLLYYRLSSFWLELSVKPLLDVFQKHTQ